MRLAFKNGFSFGYSEKEVNVTLNIGTLEAVCKALEIEFWQITDEVKKNNFDFTVELLYQGYITACKEKFRKPKYDRAKAILWHEHMSKAAQKEFMEKMTELFGAIAKMGKPDRSLKKKVEIK